MSERWVKLCHETMRKPETFQIAEALTLPSELDDRLRRFVVVGMLTEMWILFDEQTTDGFLSRFTASQMDSHIGLKGFSAAVAAVGWLEIQETGLQMPDFHEHNGKACKERATDSRRKRAEREARREAERAAQEAAARTSPASPAAPTTSKKPAAASSVPSVPDASPAKPVASGGGFEKPGFSEVPKRSPMVAWLDGFPCQPKPVESAKLKAQQPTAWLSAREIREDGTPDFDALFEWYCSQLSANVPTMRAGCLGQAAIVLATARHVSTLTTKQRNGHSPISCFVKRVREKDASELRSEQLIEAGEWIARKMELDIPAEAKAKPATAKASGRKEPEYVTAVPRAKPVPKGSLVTELAERMSKRGKDEKVPA